MISGWCVMVNFILRVEVWVWIVVGLLGGGVVFRISVECCCVMCVNFIVSLCVGRVVFLVVCR